MKDIKEFHICIIMECYSDGHLHSINTYDTKISLRRIKQIITHSLLDDRKEYRLREIRIVPVRRRII